MSERVSITTSHNGEFDHACSVSRQAIRILGEQVRSLMDHTVFDGGEAPETQDRSEMKANIMLAYRHLEDARMRLGKAIQAFDGGKSVYDK